MPYVLAIRLNSQPCLVRNLVRQPCGVCHASNAGWPYVHADMLESCLETGEFGLRLDFIGALSEWGETQPPETNGIPTYSPISKRLDFRLVQNLALSPLPH